MRHWLVLLIVLAGCTAKDAPEPPQDATQGTVSGVAVTPTIQPVAGAQLQLLPSGDTTVSDAFGRFRFAAVDPGTHRIVAEAAGHQPTTVVVHVDAGDVARPRVVLPEAPAPQAARQTMEHQGYLPAGLGPAGGTVPGDAFGSCTCRFVFPGGPDTTAFVVEAVWSDSLGRPDAPTRLRWSATLANATLTGGDSSPLHGLVTGDLVEGMLLEILPDDTWPQYDQPFQLFVTRWDVEMPPDGWSHVRGDG